jgi:hypothetical protein
MQQLSLFHEDEQMPLKPKTYVAAINSDCKIALKYMADKGIQVDSIVTDPPYELGFMGRAWDKSGIAYDQELWELCLKVLKPGGHLLAFGGSRTYHRMACAIEDAGFEIKDSLMWLFGSGFPKSRNIGCKCKEKSPHQKHERTIQIPVSQDMPSMQRGISMLEPIPSIEEQKLFENMQGQVDRSSEQQEKADGSEMGNGSGFMCSVPISCLETEGLVEKSQKPNMFTSMQWKGQSNRSCEIQQQYERAAEKRQENGRPEPSLEGRNNIQEEQGQLHRAEVCQMPPRVYSNGTQGRVCDGTPTCDVDASEQDIKPNGSSSSHRPQHAEQYIRESGIIPRQSHPQNSGMAACEKCGGIKGREGYGSALKPAHEPVVMARKPLSEKNIALNVLKHGTGGINVDGCRVEFQNEQDFNAQNRPNSLGKVFNSYQPEDSFLKKFNATQQCQKMNNPQGRFPANLIHSCFCGEYQLKSNIKENEKLELLDWLYENT